MAILLNLVKCVSENGLHPVTWLSCPSGKAIIDFLTYIGLTNKFVPLKFCNLGWYVPIFCLDHGLICIKLKTNHNLFQYIINIIYKNGILL